MMAKKLLRYGVPLVLVPLTLAFGVVLLHDRKYNIISMIVAVLACVPFFFAFEKRRASTKEMMVVAVMVAISVTGRFVFAALPGFKPVTAIVVITAMYLGPEAGFLTGALSAVVSNMYFGQGPWTPFQMFSWGIIGLLAGLLAKKGWLQNKIALSLYGVFAGVLFSQMMDVWTVLNWDGAFHWSRYLVAMTSALPFTAIYAVSNGIFLLIAAGPIGRKLERIKEKYGLMEA